MFVTLGSASRGVSAEKKVADFFWCIRLKKSAIYFSSEEGV